MLKDKELLEEQIKLMTNELNVAKDEEDLFRLKYNILLAEELIFRINTLLRYKTYTWYGTIIKE